MSDLNLTCKNLVKISSQRIKKCSDCGKEYKWPLDVGQKPFVNNNRVK